MIVTIEKQSDFISSEIHADMISIMSNTLKDIKTTDSEFVVNDKLCFKVQTNGNITPCVTNSASFISGKFQHFLAGYDGCSGETKINGQAFDGFIQRSYEHRGYKISDKNDLLRVIFEYINENNLNESMVHTLFTQFYGMYVERECHSIDALPRSVHHLFEESQLLSEFRVGVEFETGNVASSFRAINKLGVLFQQGHIDAGIFITSAERPRIWPTSNRNGSFPELVNRSYEEQISLPLICVGFSPDRYDQDAPFLSRTGSLYELVDLERTESEGLYNVFSGENREEILVRA